MINTHIAYRIRIDNNKLEAISIAYDIISRLVNFIEVSLIAVEPQDIVGDGSEGAVPKS